MITNLMTLGYNYARRRLNSLSEIVSTLTQFGRIVTCNTSRLCWSLALRGREKSLNCLSPFTKFTGMVNQEDRKTFDTYAQFTLWYSGCTHFINTYFKIYTEYKSLYPGGNTEVKGIGGLIKPQGIETIILDLEDNTDKIHNLNLENVY